MSEQVRAAKEKAMLNRQDRLEEKAARLKATQHAEAARLEAAQHAQAARREAARRGKAARRAAACLEATQHAEAARLKAAQRAKAKQAAENARKTTILCMQILAGVVFVSPIPKPHPVPVTSSLSEPPPVPVTSPPSEPPPVLVSPIPGTSSSGDSPVYKDQFMELSEQFRRILRSLDAVELLSVTYDRLLKLAKREELYNDYFVPIQFPHPKNQVRKPIADMLSHIKSVSKWITGIIIPEFKCFDPVDPLNQADATQDDVDYVRKMADAVVMALWQLADVTVVFEISRPEVNDLMWIVKEYTHYFPNKLYWFCCFVGTLQCEFWM